MQIVEIKCTNCGKEIYVQQDRIRDKMFCTLGCMSSYNGFAPTNGTKFH